MYRLIESIRLEDGTLHHLSYHQKRMDESVFRLTGKPNQIKLAEILKHLPLPATGKYKCRVVYTTTGEYTYTITPYILNPVNTLQVVYDDTIDYACKFENRGKLDQLFQARWQADDILIIKNGLVTDTSYCNVCFYDGARWITPSAPLLPGVMRQVLLDAWQIQAEEIRTGDIPKFQKVKLINALLGFTGPEFPVSQILF
jgi:4-amino-4-deoxychorismate lyase